MKNRFSAVLICSVIFSLVCMAACSKSRENLLDRYQNTETFTDFENLHKSDLEMHIVVEDQVPEELLKDLPADCMIYKHFKSLTEGYENFVLEKEVLIDGDAVESVLYSKNTSNAQLVTIKFNEKGSEILSEITYRNAGEDILLKIGETLLLHASIKSRILNGQIVFYCSDAIALKKLQQLYGSSEFNRAEIPKGFVIINKNDAESEYGKPDKMNPTDIARSFFYFYLNADERYKNFVSYQKNYEEDFDSYQKNYTSLKNPKIKIGLTQKEKVGISKKRTLNMADSYGKSSIRYKTIPVVISASGIEYSSLITVYLEKDNKGFRVVSIPR